MEVEDALQALAGALTRADVPLWNPPASLDAVEKLQTAVAPMRVPEDVLEFWRRVDVANLRVKPYPMFSTPDFALDMWEEAKRQFAAFQPLAFVAVGYQSHDTMSVELDIGDVQGGALFEWFISDPDSAFTRRFNALGDWLAYVAALIDHGLYSRNDRNDGPWLIVPESDQEEQADGMRPAPGEHPVHGNVVHVGGDILEWPEHWQRANGLRPEHLQLRGATSTVAELLADESEHETHATVAGRVVNLMGSGAGDRVRVDDCTASIDIACPVETTLLGPAVGKWYEFDVVIPAGSRPTPPRHPEHAGDDIEDPVARLSAIYMARYGGPAAAVATAVRRMPSPE